MSYRPRLLPSLHKRSANSLRRNNNLVARCTGATMVSALTWHCKGTADPTDTTLGVLCDGPRFSKAPMPSTGDLFRCSILERQGWKLHRVWTLLLPWPASAMLTIQRQVRGKVT